MSERDELWKATEAVADHVSASQDEIWNHLKQLNVGLKHGGGYTPAQRVAVAATFAALDMPYDLAYEFTVWAVSHHVGFADIDEVDIRGLGAPVAVSHCVLTLRECRHVLNHALSVAEAAI